MVKMTHMGSEQQAPTEHVRLTDETVSKEFPPDVSITVLTLDQYHTYFMHTTQFRE